MTQEADSSRSFEQAFAELEDKVRKLEQGELPLEEALNLFESGVRLQAECQQLLDAAEQRIIELTGDPAESTSSRPMA